MRAKAEYKVVGVAFPQLLEAQYQEIRETIPEVARVELSAFLRVPASCALSVARILTSVHSVPDAVEMSDILTFFSFVGYFMGYAK